MVGGFKSVTAANLMHVLFITVGMTIAMLVMVNSKEVGGLVHYSEGRSYESVVVQIWICLYDKNRSYNNYRIHIMYFMTFLLDRK